MFIDHLNQNNDDFSQYTINLDNWLGDTEKVSAVGTQPHGALVLAAGRQPDRRSIFFFVGSRDRWVGEETFDLVVHTDTGQQKTMCFTITIRESCAS